MSAQHPVSDMLTRIRNALAVSKETVSMPWSRLKQSIADLLIKEGYLTSASKVAVEGTSHYSLSIELKYHKGAAVIERISSVSTPGLRIYKGATELPTVDSGLGIAVISTPKGLMSDHSARRQGLGGEVMFYVS